MLPWGARVPAATWRSWWGLERLALLLLALLAGEVAREWVNQGPGAGRLAGGELRRVAGSATGAAVHLEPRDGLGMVCNSEYMTIVMPKLCKTLHNPSMLYMHYILYIIICNTPHVI